MDLNVRFDNTSEWKAPTMTDELQNTSSQYEFSTSLLSTKFFDVTTPFNSWNNPNSVISFETYLLIEKLIECRLQQALYYIGGPANVLCLIVFFKQGLKDRMNFILFSLSLVDFLYITTRFTFGAYCYVDEEKDPDLKENLKWYVRKHLGNLMFGFLYSSGCLTAVISVERCLCVVFPLKAANLMKTKTMILLVVGTILIMQVLCLIYTLMHQVTQVIDAVTGRTRLVWTFTELYYQYRPLIDAINFIILPGVTILTFFVVAIATTVTVVKLNQAMKWRMNVSTASHTTHDETQTTQDAKRQKALRKPTMSQNEKRQLTLVKMLVIVCFIYVACTAPMVALAFARFLVTEFSTNGQNRNIFYATHAIGNLIMMTNGSVNFFVYITQSSRFKETLLSLCPCRRIKKKASEQCSSDTNLQP